MARRNELAMEPEVFAHQALDAVSAYGGADFAAHRYTQAPRALRVAMRPDEDDEVPGMPAAAMFVAGQKLFSFA
jgi:hypothetical protein